MKLTERETAALEALCDTFVPSLAFEKDEDPALFSMSAADLVKVNHYLTRADALQDYNAVRSRHLGSARPASTLVIVQALARPGWRIEVEAVAWREA